MNHQPEQINPDFEDIMDQAYSLPNGRAKIALLEEAIRIADSLGDVEQGYSAREELVETCTFSGHPMKALVAFSWLLGQFDQQPDEYDDFTLLWSYKWILDSIASFPEINRAQIEELLADMRRRYEQFGYSERSYYYYRFSLLKDYGEVEEAQQFLDKTKAMDRDEMSDCEACEQHQFVEFEVMKGNDEQIIRTARPILRGRMTCGEVPHLTLSKVLMPLYRQGKLEEAEKYQKQGYRLIKGNRDFVLHSGEHMYYLLNIDLLQALEVFEQWVGLSLDHENPRDKMMFNAYAAVLFKRLVADGNVKSVKLPAGYPYPEEANDLPAIASRLEQMALETAGRLDQRNGNSYYTTLIQQL